MFVGGAKDSLTFGRNDSGSYSDTMSLTRDGRIGVGVGDPQSDLHISRSNSGVSSLAITNTSTGMSAIYLDASDGDLVGSDYVTISQTDDLSLNIVNAANAPVGFHTAGTERVTIKADGNVNIGQSGLNARLGVNIAPGQVPEHGLMRIGSGNYTTETVLSVSPGVISFDKNGVPGGRFKIDSSGRVGIGNPSPESSLSIKGAEGARGSAMEMNYHVIRSGKLTGTNSPERILRLPASMGTLRVVMRDGDADYRTVEYRISNVGWNYPSEFEFFQVYAANRGNGIISSSGQHIQHSHGGTGYMDIAIDIPADAWAYWSFDGVAEAPSHTGY